jgi:hypothetical protein
LPLLLGMNPLLIALLLGAAPVEEPPAATVTATANAKEIHPRVLVTADTLGLLSGNPGVEVEAPLGKSFSLYTSGHLLVPQIGQVVASSPLGAPFVLLAYAGANARPALMSVDLGSRWYTYGDAPWGIFLDAHAVALFPFHPYLPALSTPPVLFGAGGLIGYQGRIGDHLVWKVAGGIEVTPGVFSVEDPGGPVVRPAIQIGLGGWL